MAESAHVYLEVFGETKLNRDLLRIGDRAIDAQPAFELMLDEVEAIVAEQFEGEGKFSGGWTPLKPETVARKEKEGLRPEIEQATGALLDSMTVGSHGGDTRLAGPNFMQRATDVIYAHAQHAGYEPNNLPARPLVAFTESHKRGFVRTLQRYIMTGSVAPDMRMTHIQRQFPV